MENEHLYDKTRPYTPLVSRAKVDSDINSGIEQIVETASTSSTHSSRPNRAHDFSDVLPTEYYLG